MPLSRAGERSWGTLESRSVEGPASLMAQQSSGDVGCISCSQEFPSRSQGPPCACPLRQHIGDLLLKSPGVFAVTSTLQTGVPNPPVVPREVVVSLSSLYPGGPQYRSRHHVETGSSVPSRGLDISPPTRTVETLGLASERGPAHRLGSLNRGCWDHSPLQSSLHEETLCLEFESFQLYGVVTIS